MRITPFLSVLTLYAVAAPPMAEAQPRETVSWYITFQTQMRLPNSPAPFLILGERRVAVPVRVSVENATSELLWLAHPSRALAVRLHVGGRASDTVLPLRLICNDAVRINAGSASSPHSGEYVAAEQIPLAPGDGFTIECALSRQDAQALPDGAHGVAFTASGWPRLSRTSQWGDLEFRPPQDTAERKHHLRHEGLVEGRRGNFAGAVGPLEQAFQLDRTDTAIAYDLAFAHDNLRQHDEAARVLEQVVETRTAHGFDTPMVIRDLLAFEHAVAGRTTDARRIYRQTGRSEAVIEQELAKAQKYRSVR